MRSSQRQQSDGRRVAETTIEGHELGDWEAPEVTVARVPHRELAPAGPRVGDLQVRMHRNAMTYGGSGPVSACGPIYGTWFSPKMQ